MNKGKADLGFEIAVGDALFMNIRERLAQLVRYVF
jgi:hypothetical protein